MTGLYQLHSFTDSLQLYCLHDRYWVQALAYNKEQKRTEILIFMELASEEADKEKIDSLSNDGKCHGEK